MWRNVREIVNLHLDSVAPRLIYIDINSYRGLLQCLSAGLSDLGRSVHGKVKNHFFSFKYVYAIEINHKLEFNYKPFYVRAQLCGPFTRTRVIWPLFAETCARPLPSQHLLLIQMTKQDCNGAYQTYRSRCHFPVRRTQK
jgi:hypothetical protein